MNEDNGINGFLKLTEMQAENLYRRRHLEWKVILAFWVSLFFVCAFLMTNQEDINVSMDGLELTYLGIFILTILRIAKIAQENETDKRFIRHYRSQAEVHLGIKDINPGNPKKVSFAYFLKDLRSWILIILTTILLYSSFRLLMRSLF